MDTSDKEICMNTTKVSIHKNGSKVYKNSKGKLHRLDGPAIELITEGKAWYKEGLCHREKGPAIEYANGDKSWYKEGLLHRSDGPAIELVNKYNHWFILDKELEEEVFNLWILRIKIFI